jgi:hypothetical protein
MGMEHVCLGVVDKTVARAERLDRSRRVALIPPFQTVGLIPLTPVLPLARLEYGSVDKIWWRGSR